MSKTLRKAIMRRSSLETKYFKTISNGVMILLRHVTNIKLIAADFIRKKR